MGKLADTVPGHTTTQNRVSPTPDILVDGAPPTPHPGELLTRVISPEGAPSQTGVHGHSTRTETTAHISNQAPTASSPLPPSPCVADAPLFPNIVGQNAGASPILAPITFQPPIGTPLAEGTRRVDTQLVTQTRLKPRVKACVLATGERGMPVIQDTMLSLKILNNIPGLDLNHTITRTSKSINTAFDNFFDPTDISEGGILILIVSCHGAPDYRGNVSLQFETQEGSTVDSKMLREKITALPAYCTLEAIVDTCHAEGVIPGLRRILTGAPTSVITHIPSSGSRFNTRAIALSSSSNTTPSISFPLARLLNHFSPLSEQGQPKYKAKVVVWAASIISGKSYTEENLPNKPGVYSILIGAIFSYLSLNGLNINRRDMWEHVLEVVEKHNNTRHERDLRKPSEKQASITKADRIQSPVLLTSVENLEHVLSGLMFQPI